MKTASYQQTQCIILPESFSNLGGVVDIGRRGVPYSGIKGVPYSITLRPMGDQPQGQI
jgi:hypothetical protein